MTQLDVASCNQLTSINLSSNTNLQALAAGNCNLNTLNLANGNNANITYLYLVNNNNLSCIQVDNAAYCNTNWVGANYVKPAGSSYNEVCGTVSIKDTFDKNIIGMYPNPTSSILNIEVKEQTRIFILNVLGEVVKTETINGASKLNISALNAGVYFIQDSKSGKAIKFIKE
ncbi:MAG: T9SS type A sorting domain-containing protein [Bacteroidia bacterium]|nr:T9SS type A sorting domain-containing protein [Bacteroidia bacterium]